MSCTACHNKPPVVRHSLTNKQLCKECFCLHVEEDVHKTISRHELIAPGESIALGVSGGKDSSTMLHILHTLRERYPEQYGSVRFVMVAVNEGIQGYRDESLGCLQKLHRNYPYDLEIVGFEERYGRNLDEVVVTASGRSSANSKQPPGHDLEDSDDAGRARPTAKTATACSFCGILRRNSLSYGSTKTNCTKVATGHNADDNAETVLLNIIRGDAAKLVRCGEPLLDLDQGVARIKPLCRIAQRDIVIYAYLKRLDFFSVECPYATTALRGRPRRFLNNLCANPIYNPITLQIINSTRKLRLKDDRIRTSTITNLRLCPTCKSPIATSRCQCCDIRTATTADELRRAAKCKP